jgi:hypothetical protein
MLDLVRQARYITEMRLAHRARLALLIGALSLGLLGSAGINSAQAEGGVDEQFQVVKPPGLGYTGYLVNNSRSLARFWSNVATFKVENQIITGMARCKSLDKCPTNFTFQLANMNLTPCANSAEVDCISGITTKNLITGAVSKIFTPRPELTESFDVAVKGDPGIGLPNGGNPLVVSIPSAAHSAGDLYLVKSDFYTHRDANTSNRFVLDQLTNSLYPVTVETGEFFPGGPNLDPNFYVGKRVGPGTDTMNSSLSGIITDDRCLMASKTTCIKSQPFPENYSFGINLNMSKGFSGWLYGRMANPEVSVTSAANGGSIKVQILAEPVKVPIVFGWTKSSDLTPEMRERYEKDRGGGLYAGASRQEPLESVSILKGHSNRYDDLGIEEFLSWMPILGDKAVAMPSQWSFQTLNLGSNTASELSKCTARVNSLAGLVFTNASVFSSGAPAFNKSEGTLDYKVASPHTKPDGTLTSGTYDLVLNSTVARCLYGFSNAPIGATVSVLSNDGQAQLATTIINEKNGFFRMGAYGFGFSSPTIKMKITQAATKVSKSTITCIKGKTSKKVTAVKPTCPTGFKKR